MHRAEIGGGRFQNGTGRGNAPCAAGLFCNQDTKDENGHGWMGTPTCTPCASCTSRHPDKTLVDEMTLRAPSAQEVHTPSVPGGVTDCNSIALTPPGFCTQVKLTITALFLPPNSQLVIKPSQYDNEGPHTPQPWVLKGQTLPAKKVYMSEGGVMRLNLTIGEADAGAPATFLVQIDTFCVPSGLRLGCGIHGQCNAATGECVCSGGYGGTACQYPPARHRALGGSP